jgi:hypothetical protein
MLLAPSVVLIVREELPLLKHAFTSERSDNVVVAVWPCASEHISVAATPIAILSLIEPVRGLPNVNSFSFTPEQ